MSILALIAASALMMADPPAAPAAPAAAPAKAVQPAKPGAFADDDKVVCKTIEVTGSLFPKKDCRTKHDWAQLAQDSRDLTNDITTNHQAGGLPGK